MLNLIFENRILATETMVKMGEQGLFGGVTGNQIPFVRFGKGEKTLLVWSGGPGNIINQAFYQETANLIPGSTLKLYPDKGHDLIGDPATAEDILAWIADSG